MTKLNISVEHPHQDDVRTLLLRHFELMRANSPPESCHVMDPDELLDAGVTLLCVRQNRTLLGLGALARIGSTEGELKSMHTAQEARGKGIARALLRALVERARDQKMNRVSLETGTAPDFAPARMLYAAEGFTECPPFGAYVLDPLSVFMSRSI